MPVASDADALCEAPAGVATGSDPMVSGAVEADAGRGGTASDAVGDAAVPAADAGIGPGDEATDMGPVDDQDPIVAAAEAEPAGSPMVLSTGERALWLERLTDRLEQLEFLIVSSEPAEDRSPAALDLAERLDRIEASLATVAASLTDLARLDARLDALAARLEKLAEGSAGAPGPADRQTGLPEFAAAFGAALAAAFQAVGAQANRAAAAGRGDDDAEGGASSTVGLDEGAHAAPGNVAEPDGTDPDGTDPEASGLGSVIARLETVVDRLTAADPADSVAAAQAEFLRDMNLVVADLVAEARGAQDVA